MGVEDIGRGKIWAELPDTLFDGGERIVGAAFYLYGRNIMPGGDNLLLNEKVYLHTVLRFILVIAVVEEEFTAGGL